MIKRFKPAIVDWDPNLLEQNKGYVAGMIPNPNGAYVLYSDYLALQSRLESLEATLSNSSGPFYTPDYN